MVNQADQADSWQRWCERQWPSQTEGTKWTETREAAAKLCVSSISVSVFNILCYNKQKIVRERKQCLTKTFGPKHRAITFMFQFGLLRQIHSVRWNSSTTNAVKWKTPWSGSRIFFMIWWNYHPTPVPTILLVQWSILSYYYVIKHLMTLNCDQHSCKIQPQENNCSHPPPPHLPTIGLLTERATHFQL